MFIVTEYAALKAIIEVYTCRKRLQVWALQRSFMFDLLDILADMYVTCKNVAYTAAEKV